MARCSECVLCFLAILCISLCVQISLARPELGDNEIKTEVFLSPKIVLKPGLVSDKYYYNVDFPRGHVALKSFNAELIDEKGNPVPLHETYLHHWVVLRYYYRKGFEHPKHQGDRGFLQSDQITVRNSGVCDNGLSQYFGLGSETRGTATDIPDPYGIEVGNPADIPFGYKEGWILNIHAIDTRSADDKLACTECRCDLYNITVDKYGNAVPPDYIGGLTCCYDDTKCKVKDGFQGEERNLYLRYTVKYVAWDTSIVPLKIYILDVTDMWRKTDESRGVRQTHHCMVEYNVKPSPNGCTHKKTLTIDFPAAGGDVIYGVGHQHAGGTGTTLYGEGGRLICSSIPTYGKGVEAGNEAGYITGMTTCYPLPGSVKISAGETLTLVSDYSSSQLHSGVMGLFYLLIAESSTNANTTLRLNAASDVVHKGVMLTENPLWAVSLFGIVLIVVIAIIVFRGKSRREEGYEPMVV